MTQTGHQATLDGSIFAASNDAAGRERSTWALKLSIQQGSTRLAVGLLWQELWPFFEGQLPPLDRPDVARFLHDRRIDRRDELRLLGELGRRTITNQYELELFDLSVLACAT